MQPPEHQADTCTSQPSTGEQASATVSLGLHHELLLHGVVLHVAGHLLLDHGAVLHLAGVDEVRGGGKGRGRRKAGRGGQGQVTRSR